MRLPLFVELSVYAAPSDDEIVRFLRWGFPAPPFDVLRLKERKTVKSSSVLPVEFPNTLILFRIGRSVFLNNSGFPL